MHAVYLGLTSDTQKTNESLTLCFNFKELTKTFCSKVLSYPNVADADTHTFSMMWLCDSAIMILQCGYVHSHEMKWWNNWFKKHLIYVCKSIECSVINL